MSIKSLENISHDGVLYKSGEVITEITKDEALRLIKLNVAELIDNKFKKSKDKLKNEIVKRKILNRNKEEELSYVKG